MKKNIFTTLLLALILGCSSNNNQVNTESQSVHIDRDGVEYVMYKPGYSFKDPNGVTIESQALYFKKGDTNKFYIRAVAGNSFIPVSK